MIIQCLFCFLLACAASLLISPFIIKTMRALKAGQNILHYVDAHSSKQGTPTMCGLIFIFGTTLAGIFTLQGSFTLALMTLAAFLSFGLIGFLDDFIKIRTHQNAGLKPYQKIIAQSGLAIILSVFVYNFVGSTLVIPFTGLTLDIGIFIIPLAFVTTLALTNSVNLLDGLDGLASGVSICYTLGFVALMSLFLPSLAPSLLPEYQNLSALCFALVGALLAFEVFNGFPAKVFMGDTGSLAIGGFLSALALFTGLELYVLILGLPYVLTALSDIIQVAHFKRTGRRVFLMAPLHHHFEKKGIHENKIVLVYIIITILIGVTTYAVETII